LWWKRFDRSAFCLRLGEALVLQWSDVHPEPVGKARYGWLQVRDGKTKNAHRTPCGPRGPIASGEAQSGNI
jgi:hypothetical protein